jgi:hypothetical protein
VNVILAPELARRRAARLSEAEIGALIAAQRDRECECRVSGFNCDQGRQCPVRKPDRVVEIGHRVATAFCAIGVVLLIAGLLVVRFA